MSSSSSSSYPSRNVECRQLRCPEADSSKNSLDPRLTPDSKQQQQQQQYHGRPHAFEPQSVQRRKHSGGGGGKDSISSSCCSGNSIVYQRSNRNLARRLSPIPGRPHHSGISTNGSHHAAVSTPVAAADVDMAAAAAAVDIAAVAATPRSGGTSPSSSIASEDSDSPMLTGELGNAEGSAMDGRSSSVK